MVVWEWCRLLPILYQKRRLKILLSHQPSNCLCLYRMDWFNKSWQHCYGVLKKCNKIFATFLIKRKSDRCILPLQGKKIKKLFLSLIYRNKQQTYCLSNMHIRSNTRQHLTLFQSCILAVRLDMIQKFADKNHYEKLSTYVSSAVLKKLPKNHSNCRATFTKKKRFQKLVTVFFFLDTFWPKKNTRHYRVYCRRKEKRTVLCIDWVWNRMVYNHGPTEPKTKNSKNNSQI